MKTTKYFKALDNRGRMVHGGLVFDREGKPFIGTVHLLTEVNPKTVCRNTDITDSNGKDIYEHDFLCVGYGDKAYVTEVTYEDGCWCTQDGTCSLHEEFCGGDDVRVVGTNITDRLENFYENIHGNDYVKEEYLLNQSDMKIAIIILSVLLVVAVLTILAMWVAVAEWRSECNQWHTDAKKLQESNESLKAMYENECRHRAWALSQLKAQTTRADYLQGELDKATRLLNVAEWRKNKNKNNKKTKDNGKQSKAD